MEGFFFNPFLAVRKEMLSFVTLFCIAQNFFFQPNRIQEKGQFGFGRKMYIILVKRIYPNEAKLRNKKTIVKKKAQKNYIMN